MTSSWTIIFDHAAPGSLALLQALERAGRTDLVSQDQVIVTNANDRAVIKACDQFVETVLKAEQE